MTTMPADHEVLSVEFKINFLRPALAERLVARGRVLKTGRTLVVTAGDAVGMASDRSKTLIAVMQGTMIGKESDAA